MKAFPFLLMIILLGCSIKETRKPYQDSIPSIDSTTKIEENPFPDRIEHKTYTEGDLQIQEEILYTMKGQDAFYKIINSVKATKVSTGLVLWDSIFVYELGDSLRLPYFYTTFPACCGSIDGYSIRDAITGRSVARYTYLSEIEGFDFKIGYNAIRSTSFKDGPFRNTDGILMGVIFTFKSQIISKLEIRHQGKDVEYPAFTPAVSIGDRQSVLKELNNSEIYINQTRVSSIPTDQYYVRLSYDHQPPVVIFIPLSVDGSLSPICITSSLDRDWLFKVKEQLTIH